jgi:hypothetical protein
MVQITLQIKNKNKMYTKLAKGWNARRIDKFRRTQFWHGYVLHEGITYKSRVPRTSQMTSRLLRNTAAATRAHNVLCNSYYVTVITHGRCYARA